MSSSSTDYADSLGECFCHWIKLVFSKYKEQGWSLLVQGGSRKGDE